MGENILYETLDAEKYANSLKKLRLKIFKMYGDNNLVNLSIPTSTQLYQSKIPVIADYTDFSAWLLNGDDYDSFDQVATEQFITNNVSQDINNVALSDDGYCNINSRYFGVCPITKYSSIFSFAKQIKEITETIKEVEFGEYPQTIVTDKRLIKELNKLYKNGELSVTGKMYTVDAINSTDSTSDFEPISYLEFELNNEKYVCVESNEKGGIYWFNVEPIRWIVNEDIDYAITENIMFSGIQFQNSKEKYENIDETNIKRFLDSYFSMEIVPSHIYDRILGVKQSETNVKHDEINDPIASILGEISNKKQELENVRQKLMYTQTNNETEKQELNKVLQTIAEQQKRLDDKKEEIINSEYKSNKRIS